MAGGHAAELVESGRANLLLGDAALHRLVALLIDEGRLRGDASTRPVPKDVPIIYLTGLAEIAGAIGLLIPNTRRAAGMALVVQLAALFPANVNAALQGIPRAER